MVMGPGTKLSGGRPGALAAPTEREQGLSLIQHHVMRAAANAGADSAAAFRSAYMYDPREGGWHAADWARNLVNLAVTWRHAAGDLGLKASISIAAAGATN